MNIDFSCAPIYDDEYTQKAKDLYAILNIANENHLTLEELATEYMNNLQTLQKKGIEDSVLLY